MARREELEAQIDAAPTDPAAYLILGDLLLLEGDPRGDLIALDAAAGADRGASSQRRAQLLDRHPELAPPELGGLHFEWSLGFVRRVTATSAESLDVFSHPALRFVTELVLLDPEAARFSAFLVEATKRIPLLRSLAIGDPDRRHYHWPRERTRLDLPTLLDTVPQLEQLYSCEPIELGAAPRLRTLRLEGDPAVFERLQTSALPALEKLSIRDGIMRKVLAFDQIRWLLETPPPRLVDLELIDAEGDELAEALADSPMIEQLRALRLWNAGLTIKGARHLVRSCGHLDLLDLSDPLVDDATIALVAGVAREVRTISPWMREILRRPG